MRYNIEKKLEKNMQTTERPPRPGDYRRRVKVNNAIRNGELHFYHAIEAFLEMHGPEDAELDAFRQEGLTEAQSVAAWVLGTVCLSAENMERAMQVWNASESHMANMKHNVPEFTLHDLREFSALFMARMWAATKQLKDNQQMDEPAKQPKP